MDASYKIQRGIHVHLIQFFMCPEFWVHIKYEIKAAVFFSKNKNTGGVLKSPFFKDTAVSEEVSPCPFCFFTAPMICTS